MHDMERSSEPSLVPEWLRSNGSGGIGGASSSQADGPVLALPGSRSFKSLSNSDSLHSPILDRSNSSNSRRSSISNGFSKHDKNSYARPYSSFSRSHHDRPSNAGSWDSMYSDPLKGMINGRSDDSLRRSQSLISSRQSEAPLRKISTDTRNGVRKNHENGTRSISGNANGIHKVSFERDFPVLGAEDRPKTPDLIRVSSPGLSRGLQSFSISNPPSIGSETWTSALAEVPSRPGSNGSSGVGSTPATPPSASSSSSVSVSASIASGLNMAEALAQAPAQSHNASQPSIKLLKDEFALAQSKKLIPVTSLLPKTTVLSSSDKLKPKIAMRSSEAAVTPRNGVHHPSPFLVGSQPVRGASVKVDEPKSPSGKLLVLKPGRENGFTTGLKDLQIPTTNLNSRVANGQSTGPLKNSDSPKTLPGERNPPGNSINSGAKVDKRTSRSNFFKLMREKSVNNSSGTIGSGASASVNVADNLEKEVKDLACVQVAPAETDSKLKYNGETCTAVDDLSPSMKINHEEERAFLLSLGWDDKAEDGEEGITEEEIKAFCIKVKKQGTTSTRCRLLQAKLFSHTGCSSPNESNTSVSQTEA